MFVSVNFLNDEFLPPLEKYKGVLFLFRCSNVPENGKKTLFFCIVIKFVDWLNHINRENWFPTNKM